MGKVERFEDLKVWQKSRDLVKELYITYRTEKFKKDYSLIEQTKRASISIMANISEGFARRTYKEFINFLGMSHASAAELQSHLYIAFDQGYINGDDFQKLYKEAEEISKMIQSLSKYLKTLPKSFNS